MTHSPINITGTFKIESFPGDNTMVTKIWHLTESDGISDPQNAIYISNSREPDEIHVRTFEEEDYE